MSELRDLYQEMILEHGKRPRNFRFPEGANLTANGHNPLCGDRLVLKVKYEQGRVVDIGFQGTGCAICMASASTMTETVMGRQREDVDALIDKFLAMTVRNEPGAVELLPPKLAVFSGVQEYPMRVKCATLAWHTLEAALAGQVTASSEAASTPGTQTQGG